MRLSATIRRSFESARDEALWRTATAEGSREALERYAAQCTGPCAYRQQAMDRLLQRQRDSDSAKDDESWRQLSADGKYQAYLDACNRVCAYRQLALGYLGKAPANAPEPKDTQQKPPAAAVQPVVAGDPARALAEAKAAGTVEALDRFLKTYPKGRLATEARAARAMLVKPSKPAKPTPAKYEPTAAEIRAFRPTEAEKARYTPTAAQMEVWSRRYRPEYERRVLRDGRPAADQWLKQAAFDLGQRKAHEAKRQTLIDRHKARETAGR